MCFPTIPYLIKLYRCFLQRFHKAFRTAAFSLCLLDLLALLPTAFPSHRYIEDKVLPKYTDYSVVMQRWMGIFLIVAFVFFGISAFANPSGLLSGFSCNLYLFIAALPCFGAPSGVGCPVFYGSLYACYPAIMPCYCILSCIFALPVY